MTGSGERVPRQRDPAPAENTEPFGRAIPLGRWFGVRVGAHWSTLATLALFAYILAESALPSAEPGRTRLAYWLTGCVTAVVFLVTLLAHELAHAVVARHYGFRVQRITLWMLGGMTALEGEPPSPRADAFVAGAGPLASAVVGAISAGIAWTLGGAGLVGAAFVWLAGISLVLAVFNLLPGAPLDGGRLLRAILWARTHDRPRAEAGAARAGQVLGMFLIVLGFLEVLAGSMTGLWLALIGWFIVSGAMAERSAAGLSDLRGVRADEAMAAVSQPVPEWWTVRQLVDSFGPQLLGNPLLLVDFSGAPSGLMTLRDLDRVGADRQDEVRLRDLARIRGERLLRIPADADLGDVLPELSRHAGVAVVVDATGHPVGLITGGDLTRAAQLRKLGWHQTGVTHPV